jgi:hypothetical protein
MDRLTETLHRILPVFGMNHTIDKLLVSQGAVFGIKPEDSETFIGPMASPHKHIDFVAPKVGDCLGLFELGFA